MRGDPDYFDFIDRFSPPNSGRYLYRGVSAGEVAYIRSTGLIRSDERYCATREGTCFTDDFAEAVSYVTFGRDNPRRTGRSVYVIQIPREETGRSRDGYYKFHTGIPKLNVLRVWEFRPDGSASEVSLDVLR